MPLLSGNLGVGLYHVICMLREQKQKKYDYSASSLNVILLSYALQRSHIFLELPSVVNCFCKKGPNAFFC